MPRVCPEIFAIAISVTISQHARIFIDATNHGRTRACRCSIVSHTKRHGFQSLAGLRDCFNICHAEGSFDQDFEADTLGTAHRSFNLRHHHIDGIYVCCSTYLRYQNHVEAWTGFDNINHVAVHIVGVQTIDAHHHGLAAPVDVVQALNDVLAGLRFVIRCDGIFNVQENNICC